MKKFIIKTVACCLMGSMVLSYAPLTQASTAGINSVLAENVLLDNDALYAGVNGQISQYLITSAEINLNHVAEVRAAEAALEAAKEAELERQIAEALANSDYCNLGVADVDVSLNVRASASADAEVVGKLYHYNVATILNETNGWYKIQSGDVQGYVKAEYVIVGEREILQQAGTRYAEVTVSSLRVRAEASAESAVLGIVGSEDELVVLDEIDGWVKVSTEGGNGWISSEYVVCRTVYTYGETKAAIEARERREEQQRAAAAAAAAAAASKNNSSNKTYKNPTGSTGQDVVEFACQFIGNPYVWGGESLTNGVDCSGFVMKVYEAFGVSLPHSSKSLRSVGTKVDVNDMQPGDIVCYSGHVAIYIGNGQIVHASNKRDGIKISSAYYTTILAVRRIF